MKKRFLIIPFLILVFIILITLIPISLIYADTTSYTEGDFEMNVTPGYSNELNTVSIKYNGNSAYDEETMVWIAVYQPSSMFIIDETNNINNIFPYEFSGSAVLSSGSFFFTAQVFHTFNVGYVDTDWIHELRFELTNRPIVKEEPVWVRDREITCLRVWINQDNKFQFSFIYPYADNNWIKIYDLAGNLVYGADIPYDNPNVIVDLPDGQYIVKTFHDQPEPIQTFLIGKP
jgi:hypothetical protein